jgi:hypothetical protein
MGSKFLSYGDLWNLGITFSPVHLWRLERDGKFPRHIPITAGGRKAWLECNQNFIRFLASVIEPE